jgi:Domain of unknown function (DUF4258)
MKNFVLSNHAKDQAVERGILEETIFEVLNNPDKIEDEMQGQLIYQKIIYNGEIKNYLIRVFVNSNKNPNLVKTVYKTSKLSKYL